MNAKFHELEAEIVENAGLKGSVTIATNMAGRGTDIKLEDGVQETGGLKIIGTERHESRRIDNQLRGRSGRQGDPGESRFYISLEDDLMRLFGGDRVMKVVETLGMDEDEPIEHNILSKAIENAQKKVEGNNFSIRKHLLEYDQVMNEQREIIYGERMRVLSGEDMKDHIITMIKSVIERAVETHNVQSENLEQLNVSSLNEFLLPIFHKFPVLLTEEEKKTMSKEDLVNNLYDEAIKLYDLKEEEIETERMREIERVIMLRVIDQKWMDHIDDMDQMRQGISLRAYAQRDPLLEYKFVSYDMFDELSANIQNDTIKNLFNVRIVKEQKEDDPKREQVAKETFTNKDESLAKAPVKRKEAKVGRNDPCPCGSGKKYKLCCGR